MKRIGQFSVRRPLWAFAIVAAITAGLVVFLPGVTIDSSMESLFLEDGERLRYEQFKDVFGDDEIIVVGMKVSEGDVFAPSVLEKIDRLTRAIEDLPGEFGVDRVVSLTNVDDVTGADGMIDAGPFIEEIPEAEGPELDELRRQAFDNPLYVRNLVSENGRAASVNVFIEQRIGDRVYKETLVNRVRELSRDVCGDQIKCVFAGIPVLTVYSSEYMRRDMMILVPITLLVIAIVLWLTFRSVAGVLLPLCTVGLALIWTISFVGLIGGSITILSSVVPSLLLAIGVSYSIHVLAQFHQEPGGSGRERIAATMRHVAIPVAITGLTTFFGFGSLATNDVPQVFDFGVYSAFGVVASTLLALLLVPAVLRLVKPRPVVLAADRSVPGPVSSFLRGAGRLAVDRPRLIAGCGAVALALSVWGAMSVRVDTDYASNFKDGSEPVRGLEFMRDNLAGERPINIVVTGDSRDEDSVLDPAILQRLEHIEATLEAHPLVSSSLSLAGYLRNMNKAFHDGDPTMRKLPESRELAAQYLLMYDRPDEMERYLSHDGNSACVVGRSSIISSEEFLAFMEQLQQTLVAEGPGAPKVEVTGSMYLLSRASIAIPIGLAKSLGIAAVLIFALFLVLFRSLKISVIGMIANLLPILTYFAAMSFAGQTLNTGTSIAAALALGIAVDDTVHFLTRYRELRKTMSAKQAARGTVEGAGRAMVFTSVANSCGFLVLCLSSFAPLVALGWLTAVTMMMALLSDVLVLPALFVLFDRDPKPLGQLTP